MSFDITNEADSLAREVVLKQVQKDNVESRRIRIIENAGELKRLKEEGKLKEHYRLLRWCLQ